MLASFLLLLTVQTAKPPLNVVPPKTGLPLLDGRRPGKMDSMWTPASTAQYWAEYDIRGDATELSERIRAEGRKAGYRLSGKRLYPLQKGQVVCVDFKDKISGLTVTLSWVAAVPK